MEENKKRYITIGDLIVPYHIMASKKARQLRLVMDMQGLRVVKPMRKTEEDIDKILKTSSKWIYKHHLKFLKCQSESKERQWKNDEKILFHGQYYYSKVQTHEKKPVVAFDGELFEIFIKNISSVEERKKMIESSLKKWFKQEANKQIELRLTYFCNTINLTYTVFRVKEQKTRWGSCSKKGNLNFNWKLIMAPDWVLDYVIVHELSHLKYMNHSRDFWSMVSLYAPHYKEAREWLKTNSAIMTLE